MITFKCVSCGATLRVVKDKAGKQGRCPRCSLMLRIPHSQMEADNAQYALAQEHARAGQAEASSGQIARGRPVMAEPFDDSLYGSPPDQAVRKSRDRLDSHPGDPAPAPASPGTEGVSVAANAVSAPPMSWPTEASQTPAPRPTAPRGQPFAPPAGAAPASAPHPAAPSATASVRGSHGALALLVLLVVAVGTVSWVGWRSWKHTWGYSSVITLCRPAVTFAASAGEPQANSLRGKVVVCNEIGAPSAVTSATDADLLATSATEVKAVIFVRRNDQTPQAKAFQVSGRILAVAPVGYEVCAVDVDTRHTLWTATVGAEDEPRAARALYGLIRRCMVPAGQ